MSDSFMQLFNDLFTETLNNVDDDKMPVTYGSQVTLLEDFNESDNK